ncbi:MAG: hypothetical protein AAFR52_13790 [Pseudomonadota bacterium]
MTRLTAAMPAFAVALVAVLPHRAPAATVCVVEDGTAPRVADTAIPTGCGEGAVEGAAARPPSERRAVAEGAARSIIVCIDGGGCVALGPLGRRTAAAGAE